MSLARLLGESSLEKYALVVAEKPAAAEHIAKALDKKGRPKRCKEKNVPYYVAERDRKIVVVPSIGHLYTVSQDEKRRQYYPVFDYKWVPRHLAEKKAERTKVWLETIKKLGANANAFFDACDNDVEGNLIGYCIFNYALGKAEAAKRMVYSTLTKAELSQAYENPLSTLDFGSIEAGKARHEIDWLYGVNLSRALSSAAKKAAGKYVSLSTGRVQGPTLQFLASREDAISNFVSTPYYTVKAQVVIGGKKFLAEYEKKTVKTRSAAESIVKNCQTETGTVAVFEEAIVKQHPPPPFNLSTLQSEAHRLFGYSPKRTVNLAEKLYLNALASYPRTNSQKLPPTINYRSILTGLRSSAEHRKLVSELLGQEKLKPREGEKEDSAHPAIYPTGNTPKHEMTRSEAKLWNLIVKRFTAVFASPAEKKLAKVEIDVNRHRFHLPGRTLLKEGWIRFYKPHIHFENTLLPQVAVGDKVNVNSVDCEHKFTKPPPRYTPSSLLKKMEREGVGTKGTRAEIIQTLYNRKYIAEESITVTALGREVSGILRKHVPTVTSAKLTRKLEHRMQLVQEGKEARETVVAHAIENLKPMLKELKSQEEIIGQTLYKAVKQLKSQRYTFGSCPTCKTGKLHILVSRRTGKRFVGCTSYYQGKCQTSLPLPQTGTVKPTGSTCSHCGFPTATLSGKRRKRWRTCLNPSCPQKKNKGTT